MDNKLEKQLSDRFAFMQGKNLFTLKPTNNPKYLECMDGWYELIYNLCTELEQWYIDNNQYTSSIMVWQVKEKFGGLRFYADVFREAHPIIDKYEDMSYTICESCGKKGELREDRYWIQTLCDECNIKLRR